MHRRALLASALAAAAPLATGARAAGVRGDAEAVRALTLDAYPFLLPLIEMMRTRDHTLAEGPANTFRHRRNLQGPSDRRVTMTNNDTLYSTAFLDLRAGPARLGFPATGERYFSVALMDAWSNNFHVAGTRNDGGRAGKLLVATRGQAAALRPAAGERLVIAPTDWVWALGRVLTTGGADLAAARAVQDGLTLGGRLGAPPPPKAPEADADFATLARLVGPLAADAGVLAHDEPMVRSLARRAEAAGLHSGPSAMTAATRAAGDAALATARRRAPMPTQPEVDGWTYPKPDIGDFGTDYRYRAEIAVVALAALPREEAMYIWAVGPGAPGAPLTFDGRRDWRLDLPPLPLRQGGFWSLSLYEAEPSGGLFFIENPLKRYTVGDRTPGLTRAPDGGVSLHIGAAEPSGADRANWLPAPAGPFRLVMRAFLPGPALLDGRFRLPRVRAA